MTNTPLNMLQKLMRRWDAVHPYNAAQLMKLEGSPEAEAWRSAWHSTLSQTGLGAVSLERNRYHFVPLNGHLAAYHVRFPTADLADHISAELNHPFNDPHEPPFRPFIIRQDNHFYAGLIYQHWLADSASIRMLMHEWFVRVYDPAAANAQPMRLASAGYWRTIGPRRGGWTIAKSVVDMSRRHLRLRRVQKIDSNRPGRPLDWFPTDPRRARADRSRSFRRPRPGG